MDERCADLNGDSVLGAKEARRAWDNLCLVTGDGLLPPTDTAAGLSTVGLIAVLGLEALGMDTLRLEGRAGRVFGGVGFTALD